MAQASLYLPLSLAPTRLKWLDFMTDLFWEADVAPGAQVNGFPSPTPAAPKQRFPFLPSIEKLPKPLLTVQQTQKQARKNDVNLNFCLIK